MNYAQKTDALQWNAEQVFHSGDSFFSALLYELDRARYSIEIEAYIFENDDLGKKVARKLIAAARRGVRVRVLVDGVGSPYWHRDFYRAFAKAGIESKVFHPFPWVTGFSLRHLYPSHALRRFLEVISKLNRRDHRKLYIVDQRSAWIGSLNISACHMRYFSGNEAWRDTGVRIEDRRVQTLFFAFEAAWNEASGLKLYKHYSFSGWRRYKKMVLSHPSLRLNHTYSLRNQVYWELVRRIKNAKNRIWVTNPYFVPRSGLLHALRIAAKSGIDVRLLVPNRSDVFFMPWVSSIFYYTLIKAGVRVFEYEPTVLHAKTILVDDWITVGSTNLNHRSLIHDLEVDVILSQRESRESVAKQFLVDLNSATEVTLDRWKRRPWIEQILGRALLLVKHWI